uniref:Uncharacterized protein n=1 Tax=Cyanistes caeruleus TaxID=156563 RepID=A0A8C0VHT6_CYACU
SLIWKRFLRVLIPCYTVVFIVLLEAIMKNGSTAGGGAYCRKSTSSSDQSKPNSTKEGNASAAGESGKGYNKEQMEGVLRYGLNMSLLFILCIMYLSFQLLPFKGATESLYFTQRGYLH